MKEISVELISGRLTAPVEGLLRDSENKEDLDRVRKEQIKKFHHSAESVGKQSGHELPLPSEILLEGEEVGHTVYSLPTRPPLKGQTESTLTASFIKWES